MADENIRELQGAVVAGFGDLGIPDAGERITVQVQYRGDTLVCRCRFDLLRQRTKTGGLTPVTETTYEHALFVSPQALLKDWARQVVPLDALTLAYSEVCVRYRKYGFRWPQGWPVPAHSVYRETQAARLRREQAGH